MSFSQLRYKGNLVFTIYNSLYRLYRALRYDWVDDATHLKRIFKIRQGYDLNLDNPKSLNEKIQWLKINDRKPLYTQLADKFAAREFVKDFFGEEYLIPLLYSTTDYRDIRPENMPDGHFIVKANHDSGSFKIVRDKTKVDWKKMQANCRWWLSINYFGFEREWCYKNIVPRIVVERLLETKAGKIPNDYKIHCIHGKVAFVYVSVDREGTNKRNIYDAQWKPLSFTWAAKEKNADKQRGAEIDPPASYAEMVQMAEKVAAMFPYVRVDFYDVDGKIYFGEITQFHGGGFDQIRPIEWDYALGERIDLSSLKND
ncbi:MAG: glycosyl transferase [Flavobacterium sp. BFFFF2]|nr:MAG: glycosyl transferase [Flavobacterium sp. BFFFF2]